MNKTKKSYILIIIFLLIIIVVSYFRENDSKVRISSEYNSDTNITKTFEYIIRNGDTILQGKFSEINGKGIKISEGNYVNNNPYGKCTYYYEDGPVESIQYRVGNNLNAEATWYSKNGQIESYIMYDNKGRPVFKIIFDENGVVKYKGYSLLGIYNNTPLKAIKKKEIFHVGDVLKYEYLLANIPKAKRIFKIESPEFDINKRKITKKTPTNIRVEEVLTKKGINTIRAIVNYEFNDKFMPTLKDTVSFDIEVR
jgi:hypothetical protein